VVAAAVGVFLPVVVLQVPAVLRAATPSHPTPLVVVAAAGEAAAEADSA
jgi:hypothetical protein